MRINRFVFLNLPILSLGEHLGLTVSPHSPLPAGYVILPANSRSPPLGLMLFHSEEQASSYLLPPCIPRISTSAYAESRRTVGDVCAPYLIWACNINASEQIRINLVLRVRKAGIWPRSHSCQSQNSHQSLNPLTVDDKPSDAQMHHHLSASVERVTRVFGINQSKYQQLLFVGHDVQKRHIKGRTVDAS